MSSYQALSFFLADVADRATQGFSTPQANLSKTPLLPQAPSTSVLHVKRKYKKTPTVEFKVQRSDRLKKLHKDSRKNHVCTRSVYLVLMSPFHVEQGSQEAEQLLWST
jgi:hypothetical protein